MITKLFFLIIIIAVIIQRLWELQISKRNSAYILAQGGKEHGENLLGMVKFLQISWCIAMIAEVWYFNRPFIPSLAVIMVIAIVIAQVLRYLSMQALQWRWTLPIMTVPGMPPVDAGIYNHLRHPSWLGVIIEIACLPLIHGAYLTAIFFSLANAWVMSQRVLAEEDALTQENPNYGAILASKPRFVPAIKWFRLLPNTQK